MLHTHGGLQQAGGLLEVKGKVHPTVFHEGTGGE